MSNFLCAACNNHWEQHETFIERASEREQENLPTGDFYMPFAELPDMQQVIFTGSDAHMPSPYLDAQPARSIQQGGDARRRATPLRKFVVDMSNDKTFIVNVGSTRATRSRTSPFVFTCSTNSIGHRTVDAFISRTSTLRFM
jgi:hypothetical protein